MISTSNSTSTIMTENDIKNGSSGIQNQSKGEDNQNKSVNTESTQNNEL